MTDLRPHEYCSLPDRLHPQELAKLEQSMREQGFREEEPIILFQGKILDGWHRYIAAMKAGVNPVFKQFEGTEAEALEYAYFRLFARRHVAQGRKAAVALLYNKIRTENGKPSMTHEQLHEATGVSKSYISQAASVENRAPGSLPKIASGELSLSKQHRELQKSVPGRPDDISDPLCDVWETAKRWKLVMYRIIELSERDIDPLMARRGSEVILESLSSKVRENGKVRLGKTFTQDTIDKIEGNIPHMECQQCQGLGCEVCQFRGWWTVSEAKARKIK